MLLHGGAKSGGANFNAREAGSGSPPLAFGFRVRVQVQDLAFRALGSGLGREK